MNNDNVTPAGSALPRDAAGRDGVPITDTVAPLAFDATSFRPGFILGPDDDASPLADPQLVGERGLARVPVHESSHVCIARLGHFPVSSATVCSDQHFAGLVRTNDETELVTPRSIIETARNLCDKARSLAPKPGEDRDCVAVWVEHSPWRCLELLAGREGERIAGFDDNGGAATDLKVAKMYAETVCLSPAAVDAFLAYCAIEARSLLKRYWHCVEAVAQALQERWTLTGDEIDAVIVEAEASREHEAELMRRHAMAKAAERAAKLIKGRLGF